MRSEKHIVVIGAGVIGLCTAVYLRQRGHRVTVLDQAGPAHEGCSFGNAGLIVPSHIIPLAAPGMVALGLKWMRNPESPFWIKPRLDWDLLTWAFRFWRAATKERVARAAPLLCELNLASRAAYEELANSRGNDFGLIKNGLLMLCNSNHGFEEEKLVAKKAQTLGLPAETLSPAQAAELDPGARLNIVGAIYYPKDCHLSPHVFIRGLRLRLEQDGVQFSWQTGVQDFRVAAGRIECAGTNKGDFEADEYVIAGGSWSPVLTRRLGLKIPMQAGKGYSLTLPSPRPLPILSAICTEARVAVTPMGKSLRFAGTMEIAGMNEVINPARVRGIIKSVPKYYPEFTADDFSEIKPWCGLRPCSPDGLPYVGRTARYSNLSIAAGHAMMGLSLGPVTGQLIAQIISGEKPSIDIRLLDPDRYT